MQVNLTPVKVAVHIVLPVADVDQDVPLEAGLAGLGVGRPSGTLVVDTADLRVREMSLLCRALEVRHRGGRLGHVEVAVPVSTSDGQQVFQGGRSEMREREERYERWSNWGDPLTWACSAELQCQSAWFAQVAQLLLCSAFGTMIAHSESE